jgi:hypothetical protein
MPQGGNRATVQKGMAGRDEDGATIREDEVNDLVAGRNGHRPDLIDDRRDGLPEAIAGPDRIAGPNILDCDLAARSRDLRATGKADRARWRAAWLLAVDVDRSVGRDGADDAHDGRRSARVRTGPAEPGIETPAAGRRRERQGPKHLPLAVGREEPIASRRRRSVEPEMRGDRGPGGGVGPHRRQMLSCRPRLVGTRDRVEVGVAVDQRSEPDEQRFLRGCLGERGSSGRWRRTRRRGARAAGDQRNQDPDDDGRAMRRGGGGPSNGPDAWCRRSVPARWPNGARSGLYRG